MPLLRQRTNIIEQLSHAIKVTHLSHDVGLSYLGHSQSIGPARDHEDSSLEIQLEVGINCITRPEIGDQKNGN